MKLKTHKATSKRFTVSKPKKGSSRKKKFMERRTGQDHFNARSSGNVVRRKRRNHVAANANEKTLKTLLPYS